MAGDYLSVLSTPLKHCIQYIHIHIHREKGGGEGGRVEPDKPVLTADNKETHMKKEPHILFMYVKF